MIKTTVGELFNHKEKLSYLRLSKIGSIETEDITFHLEKDNIDGYNYFYTNYPLHSKFKKLDETKVVGNKVFNYRSQIPNSVSLELKYSTGLKFKVGDWVYIKSKGFSKQYKIEKYSGLTVMSSSFPYTLDIPDNITTNIFNDSELAPVSTPEPEKEEEKKKTRFEVGDKVIIRESEIPAGIKQRPIVGTIKKVYNPETHTYPYIVQLDDPALTSELASIYNDNEVDAYVPTSKTNENGEDLEEDPIIQIGDEVVLSKKGRKVFLNTIHNPHDYVGVVKDILGSGNIIVNWENGKRNNYPDSFLLTTDIPRGIRRPKSKDSKLLAVGTTVRLSYEGKEKYRNAANNPHHLQGTITKNDNLHGQPYLVKWVNDFTNSYHLKDLVEASDKKLRADDIDRDPVPRLIDPISSYPKGHVYPSIDLELGIGKSKTEEEVSPSSIRINTKKGKRSALKVSNNVQAPVVKVKGQ